MLNQKQHILTVAASAFLIALAVPPLFAATEFEDAVPLALVKALLGNPQLGDVEVFSDIPEGFPDFEIPAGFNVIGGADRGYTLSVILLSDLAGNDAVEQMTESFVDAGFTDIQAAASPYSSQTGFISDQPDIARAILCRDGAPNISISAFTQDNMNVVSLGTSGRANAFGSGNAPSCAEMANPQNPAFNPMARISALRQHIPRLVVPDDASRQPRAMIGSSGSNSGNSAETESAVSIDWPLSQVYRHFADQIVAQGWELDTESVGDISASGNWQREADPDLSLHGTLSVLETAESHFQLLFRLTKIGDEP